MSKRALQAVFASVLMLVLAGCMNNAKPNDPEYAPVTAQDLQQPRETNGAIYQAGSEMSLYGDRRAHRVGDIIVINLEETTQSSKSASSSADKSASASISNPTVLGSQFGVAGLSLDSSLSGSSNFSGSGDTSQANNLAGTIAVTVSEVMPNGIMKVRGEKWLTLSTGDEYIRITGMIRPEDVTPENEISSTRVADARITYSGNGQTQAAATMGWLSRFFISAIWPF
ncbi:flagellar basal body L-ring protein FlgH [Pokkaliibacter sp. CJK22405]|uniref:flagellar basal body L-ring protein FlgH n=1 Tax=Pokkaliibacter sp. CJK22405 TaxID=3384615 RepID=UPI0039853B29